MSFYSQVFLLWKKWEVLRKNFAAYPGDPNWQLFFTGYLSYLKEWLLWNYVYSDWVVFERHCLTWSKRACHFKDNDNCIDAGDKIRAFKQVLEFWKSCIYCWRGCQDFFGMRFLVILASRILLLLLFREMHKSLENLRSTVFQMTKAWYDEITQGQKGHAECRRESCLFWNMECGRLPDTPPESTLQLASKNYPL